MSSSTSNCEAAGERCWYPSCPQLSHCMKESDNICRAVSRMCCLEEAHPRDKMGCVPSRQHILEETHPTDSPAEGNEGGEREMRSCCHPHGQCHVQHRWWGLVAWQCRGKNSLCLPLSQIAFPLFLNELDAESLEEFSSTKLAVSDFQEINQTGQN